MTIWCRRKLDTLVLLLWRTLSRRLWTNGSYKHSCMVRLICKFYWDSEPLGCNLLAMAIGVLPLFGCSLQSSSSKAGLKFGDTSVSLGRWLPRKTVFLSPSCLEDIWQPSQIWWKMEYQEIYFGIMMDRALVRYRRGLGHLGSMLEWSFWDGRTHAWNSSLLRFIMIFGLSC